MVAFDCAVWLHRTAGLWAPNGWMLADLAALPWWTVFQLVGFDAGVRQVLFEVS